MQAINVFILGTLIYCFMWCGMVNVPSQKLAKLMGLCGTLVATIHTCMNCAGASPACCMETGAGFKIILSLTALLDWTKIWKHLFENSMNSLLIF